MYTPSQPQPDRVYNETLLKERGLFLPGRFSCACLPTSRVIMPDVAHTRPFHGDPFLQRPQSNFSRRVARKTGALGISRPSGAIVKKRSLSSSGITWLQQLASSNGLALITWLIKETKLNFFLVFQIKVNSSINIENRNDLVRPESTLDDGTTRSDPHKNKLPPPLPQFLLNLIKLVHDRPRNKTKRKRRKKKPQVDRKDISDSPPLANEFIDNFLIPRSRHV